MPSRLAFGNGVQGVNACAIVSSSRPTSNAFTSVKARPLSTPNGNPVASLQTSTPVSVPKKTLVTSQAYPAYIPSDDAAAALAKAADALTLQNAPAAPQA